MSEEDGREWDEVVDQVSYLSRAMDEVLVWMSEAERSGSVPPGLRSRSQDLAKLNRLLIHIESLRDTLELIRSNDNMGSVRDLLVESLSEMDAKARELRNRLTYEET